jgi:hypothetical protein
MPLLDPDPESCDVLDDVGSCSLVRAFSLLAYVDYDTDILYKKIRLLRHGERPLLAMMTHSFLSQIAKEERDIMRVNSDVHTAVALIE